MFTFKLAPSCDRHPRQIQRSGGLRSDAAGRYQVLSTTWDGLRLPSFNPENQERGGATLVAKRGVSLPSTRPLSATEFANAIVAMACEWASLPMGSSARSKGCYGQPIKTMSQLRSQYCAAAGC
jgi:muramidase (phage lysozyme)